MKTLTALAQTYVDRFESALDTLPGKGDRNITTLRKSGLEIFRKADFPHRKIEDWRFTNLSEFSKGIANDISIPEADTVSANFDSALEIVFVDGFFSAYLSKLDELPKGLSVTSFADELGNGAVLSLNDDENRALVALNTAFMQDGFCVHVAESTVVNAPLIIRFKNTASDAGRHLRNRVIVGENAKLTVLEIHEGSGRYFSNPMTTIALSKGAELNHYKLQKESIDAYHLALTEAEILQGAKYNNFSLSIGAKLSRNEFNTSVLGSDSESQLNGAYLMRGKQHCDTTTVTDHKVPNNVSKQIYKGVLDDHARGVFQGKIHIFPDAQQVSGDQLSKALLLSDFAEVDCKPELEIYADDVKCSHGATSGELDDAALFYMESRGVPKEQARMMLIEAFLADVLEEITDEQIKDLFSEQAASWLAEVDN